MAREHNFLLGQGERLAVHVKIQKGGSPKNDPYDFPLARSRIAQRLSTVRKQLATIPAEACPRDEAVAIVTLHPRYLSKSDFPQGLFNAVGVRPLGSRPRVIVPDNWGTKKDKGEEEESGATEDIFVAGARTAFAEWNERITHWTPKTPGAMDLPHIEDLQAFDAKLKLKSIPKSDGSTTLFEVAIHNSGTTQILRAFADYANKIGVEVLSNIEIKARGLTFVAVRGPAEKAEKIAQFVFVRVVRGMPIIRPIISIARESTGFGVNIPNVPVQDTGTKAVIFDGGLPSKTRAALQNWVTYIDPPGIANPVADFEIF